MNKKQIYNILLKSSGFILLILILLRLDIQQITDNLVNINFIAISPLFFLFLCIMYLKTQRFKILLVNSGINIAGQNLFSIYAGSFLPGAITPGRIGEVIKYKMIKGKNNDNNLKFTLSVQDRIWDVSFVLLIGSLYFIYVINNMVYLLFILPFLLLFIFTSLWPETIIQAMASLLSKYFSNSSFAKKINNLSKRIIKLSPKHLAGCLIFTIISWLIYFFQAYLLFSATGLTYSFVFLSCVIATAGLIALLPISIAGIGTRDLALVGLFSLSGKSPETGIVLSACLLLIFLANCIISLPFWMYESRSIATPV